MKMKFSVLMSVYKNTSENKQNNSRNQTDECRRNSLEEVFRISFVKRIIECHRFLQIFPIGVDQVGHFFSGIIIIGGTGGGAAIGHISINLIRILCGQILLIGHPGQIILIFIPENAVFIVFRNTDAASIGLVAKRPEQSGKALIFPAMVETYAILALLVSILAVSGVAGMAI